MKTRGELFWEWKCLNYELNAYENLLNTWANQEDDILQGKRSFEDWKEFKEYFNNFIDQNPELDLSDYKL